MAMYCACGDQYGNCFCDQNPFRRPEVRVTKEELFAEVRKSTDEELAALINVVRDVALERGVPIDNLTIKISGSVVHKAVKAQLTGKGVFVEAITKSIEKLAADGAMERAAIAQMTAAMGAHWRPEIRKLIATEVKMIVNEVITNTITTELAEAVRNMLLGKGLVKSS